MSAWQGFLADSERFIQESRHRADLREYGDTIQAWKKHSDQQQQEIESLKEQLREMTESRDRKVALLKGAEETSTTFLNKFREAEAKAAKLEQSLRESQEDNIQNYVEKKAVYLYAARLREANGIAPIYEPFLTVSPMGNFIRGKIRAAALRVWRAGGSLPDATQAAVREFDEQMKYPGDHPTTEGLRREERKAMLEAAHAAGRLLEIRDPEVLKTHKINNLTFNGIALTV